MDETLRLALRAITLLALLGVSIFLYLTFEPYKNRTAAEKIVYEEMLNASKGYVCTNTTWLECIPETGIGCKPELFKTLSPDKKVNLTELLLNYSKK